MELKIPRRSIKNISIVSLGTAFSRLLGLLRDIIFFSVLGTGAIPSAFITAFTLPNLFRRLLGEGVLTSVFVPIFSETLEREDKRTAFYFFNQIFSRLLFVTALFVLVGWLALFSVQFIPDLSERYYQMSRYGFLLFPYIIPVCLAALLAAALQGMHAFVTPAFSQVWLNFCMIAVLLSLFFFGIKHNETIVLGLCFAVLVGGCMQFFIPAIDLKRKGWSPAWNLSCSEQQRLLEKLFWPGVAGAAVFQVNQAFSRLLALWINDSAASILYLASRLLEFPLGVFVISVTTVIFPKLSQFAAREAYDRLANIFRNGLLLIWAITAPAAVGLYLLREPILLLLFGWGSFSQDDLSETAPVLSVFALGLPFYAFAALYTRGFHALKDMRTPVRLAFVNLSLNIILGLGVALSAGTTLQLAWVSVIVAFIHCFVLIYFFKRKHLQNYKIFSGMPFLKVFAATVIMAVSVDLSWITLQSLVISEKIAALLALGFVIPMAVLIYGLLLWSTHFFKQINLE